MICIETIDEVIADDILRLAAAAQGIGDEFQVFVQRVCTVHRFHELHKPADNIILEVFIVANWDDGILVWQELSVDDLKWLYTALTRAVKKVYLVNFQDKYFK